MDITLTLRKGITMKLGEIAQYRVERETDLGYMITNEDGTFFLHHNESAGQFFKIDDVIEAFLYVDKKRRIAATCNKPIITVSKGGFCEVVATSTAGVFVHIGISRDILLSSDQLEMGKWPEVGDKLCCILRARGTNLFIRLLNKEEILALSDQYPLTVNQKYEGYVYRITDHGINVVTNNYNIVFVYIKNLRKSYRLGEKVEVFIIRKNDNDYSGTIVEPKVKTIDDDAAVILSYLESHYGVMPYTSDTSPDIILRVFQMSKGSFKKALGHLYKNKKVILEEKKTIMIDYK